MELQWELMIFTLFVSLGAGIFAVQGVLAIKKIGFNVQLPALIASFLSIIIAGIGSFMHLKHWERIFNGFGNLTSGITQELIGIVVFFVALIIFFIMIRRSEGNGLPAWCGIMAIIVGAALIIVMANSYSMAARPVWDTPLMWLYYLSNGAFFGSLVVGALLGIKKEGSLTPAASSSDGASEEVSRQEKADPGGFICKFALFVGIAQVVLTAAYTAYIFMAASAFTSVGYYFDSTRPTAQMVDPSATLMSVFTGEYALVFWLGVVIVGLLIPLASLLILRTKNGNFATGLYVLGLVCALAGGLCFRIVLYVLGISTFPFF